MNDFFNTGTETKDVRMSSQDKSNCSEEDQEMKEINTVPKPQPQAKAVRVNGKKRVKALKNIQDEIDEPEPSKKRKLNTMITQSNFAKRPITSFQQKSNH